MKTEDWALTISLCSFAVSLAGFFWNVWSKFIYPKPRVRTFARVVSKFPREPGEDDRIDFTAINHGPGDVILHAAVVIIKPRFWFLWFRKNIKIGYLNPLKNYYDQSTKTGPFSGGLPKKIAVGESFPVYFTIMAAGNWLSKNPSRFGFVDSFGKYHWCSRLNARRFKEQLRNAVKEQVKEKS